MKTLLLVAESDPARALEILRTAEANNRHDPELYTDLGRIDQSPAGRLGALRRARDLGASQPNLLVWIAEASIDAGELEQAEQAGRELLALVAEARARYGDALDWPERGRELWVRVSNAFPERSTAREFVTAHSSHANRKHWAHTVLGVVAVRRGDIEAAIGHLGESASVVAEPRPSTYGPSFRLARELVTHGRWNDIAAFLQACRAFWDDEEMDAWLVDVAARRIPEFPDQ